MSPTRPGRVACALRGVAGHTDICKLLLELGASVNSRNVDGHTPLHFACQYNHTEVTELLLEWGAHTEVHDRSGNTPLQFCAANGHLQCAQLLLSRGARVLSANRRGDTPLHSAARWGFVHLVQAFIAAGADVYVTNKQHLSPLQVAGGTAVRQLMLRATAERNVQSTIAAAGALVARGARDRTRSEVERHVTDVRYELAATSDSVGAMAGHGSAAVGTAANPLLPEQLLQRLDRAGKRRTLSSVTMDELANRAPTTTESVVPVAARLSLHPLEDLFHDTEAQMARAHASLMHAIVHFDAATGLRHVQPPPPPPDRSGMIPLQAPLSTADNAPMRLTAEADGSAEMQEIRAPERPSEAPESA